LPLGTCSIINRVKDEHAKVSRSRRLLPQPHGRRTLRFIGRKDNTMKKYVCDVCGWVYNPEFGDPDQSVAPGTSFENVLDTWVCPQCGVHKDNFTPIAYENSATPLTADAQIGCTK
jgi:rubredoxin